VLRAFPFSATVLSRGVCGTAEMPVAPASTRAARFGCGAHAGPRGVLARAFVSPHASLPAALCRCEHHKQGAEKMLAVGEHATQRKWPHVPVQVAAPCSVEGGCYSADSKRFGMTSTSYCARPQQREQCSRSIENAPQSTSYLCKYFQPAMQASTLGTRTSHGCDDFQAEQPYTCRSGAARARRHAWSSAAPFLRRSGLPFLTVAITMSPHMLAQVSDHEISCQSVIISPLR